jgi:hypothetical protein
MILQFLVSSMLYLFVNIMMYIHEQHIVRGSDVMISGKFNVLMMYHCAHHNVTCHELAVLGLWF